MAGIFDVRRKRIARARQQGLPAKAKWVKFESKIDFMGIQHKVTCGSQFSIRHCMKSPLEIKVPSAP